MCKDKKVVKGILGGGVAYIRLRSRDQAIEDVRRAAGLDDEESKEIIEKPGVGLVALSSLITEANQARNPKAPFGRRGEAERGLRG